jgi:hypothetical protein
MGHRELAIKHGDSGPDVRSESIGAPESEPNLDCRGESLLGVLGMRLGNYGVRPQPRVLALPGSGNSQTTRCRPRIVREDSVDAIAVERASRLVEMSCQRTRALREMT